MDLLRKSPWLVTGCLVIFAVPFVGAGILIIFTGVTNAKAGPVAVVFGVVFILMACGFVVGGNAVARRFADGIARATAAPSGTDGAPAPVRVFRPWLMRPDWAANTVADSNPNTSLLLLLFAVFWNSIVWPMLWTGRDLLVLQPKPVILFALACGVIGIVLLFGGVREASRRQRFGQSTCHLEHVPLQPGMTFRGSVTVTGRNVPETAFRLHLTGSRDSAPSTSFDAQKIVRGASIVRASDGSSIPFEFSLPRDATPSESVYSRKRYRHWVLAVTDESSLGYLAQFVLPVFLNSGLSEPDVEPTRVAVRLEDARQEVGPEAGVVTRMGVDGVLQISVKPQLSPGLVIGPLIFIVLWFGFAALMFNTGSFVIATIVSLIGLVVVYGMGSALLTTSSIRVHQGQIDFGPGFAKTMSGGAVAAIIPQAAARSGSLALYDLYAVAPDGARTAIVKHIVGRINADIVAARILLALGHES